jgi:hypothetical protein
MPNPPISSTPLRYSYLAIQDGRGSTTAHDEVPDVTVSFDVRPHASWFGNNAVRGSHSSHGGVVDIPIQIVLMILGVGIQSGAREEGHPSRHRVGFTRVACRSVIGVNLPSLCSDFKATMYFGFLARGFDGETTGTPKFMVMCEKVGVLNGSAVAMV